MPNEYWFLNWRPNFGGATYRLIEDRKCFQSTKIWQIKWLLHHRNYFKIQPWEIEYDTGLSIMSWLINAQNQNKSFWYMFWTSILVSSCLISNEDCSLILIALQSLTIASSEMSFKIQLQTSKSIYIFLSDERPITIVKLDFPMPKLVSKHNHSSITSRITPKAKAKAKTKIKTKPKKSNNTKFEHQSKSQT